MIYRGACFIIWLPGYDSGIDLIRLRMGQEEWNVTKVNQEALAGEIGKLKEKAKAASEKSGGKKSDPAVRKARKRVKRAQRKLRAAKAYKSGGKKKGEAAAS